MRTSPPPPHTHLPPISPPPSHSCTHANKNPNPRVLAFTNSIYDPFCGYLILFFLLDSTWWYRPAKDALYDSRRFSILWWFLRDSHCHYSPRLSTLLPRYSNGFFLTGGSAAALPHSRDFDPFRFREVTRNAARFSRSFRKFSQKKNKNDLEWHGRECVRKVFIPPVFSPVDEGTREKKKPQNSLKVNSAHSSIWTYWPEKN